MLNRRTLLASLAALPAAAYAQHSPPNLAGDIGILRQALALHPGTYRYNTPANMGGRLQRLERDFVAAPDRAQRYLLLSRFLATIRDGHTYCNFFNQSRAVATELFDQPTRVPFHFRWIGGRMVVTAHGGPALPPGTIVERLNGVTDRDLLARLLPYTRTDGHNEAKRVSLLEVRGTENIETFDVFHGLVFGPPPGGRHRIEATTPADRRTAAELPVISLADRRQQMVGRDSGDGPIWTWTVRPDGVALLDMPSWVLYNSKWDWESWLRGNSTRCPRSRAWSSICAATKAATTAGRPFSRG